MKFILKIIIIIIFLSPIIAQAENAHPVIDNPFLNFKALKNVSVEEVQNLINQGYDINEANDSGVTILHVMVDRNSKNIVTLLIKAGADVNAIDTGGGGERVLHTAAYRNYPEIIQLLIDAGADIDVKNKYGSSPLHRAASQGSIDAMRILLQAGADPNARTKTGGTPFMGAVGHAFIPDWDEGKEFYEDYTAEERAHEKARGEQSIIDSLAMLKLLLEYGADPHAVNHNGKNARNSLRGYGGYYDAPEVVKYLDKLGVK